MNRHAVLAADAAINLLLGILLLAFRPELAGFLGVPMTEQTFYPTILGGVLFGIGVALLIEVLGRPKKLSGLGLGGTVAINLCGGIVLMVWLTSGRLSIPLRGEVLLWALVAVLVGISAMEIWAHFRRGAGTGKG